jgi:NarL family two-component system response regulator LiaR
LIDLKDTDHSNFGPSDVIRRPFEFVMRRTVIIYGLAMAVLIGLLRLVEYRFLIRDIPLEFYIGFVAVMFTGLGIWAGLRLTRPKIVEIAVTGPFERDDGALRGLGISKRELEVLELIAAGLSNQDIAERLFVSTSTVKTHVSNVLAKLDASRRTEAIARAQQLRIIP